MTHPDSLLRRAGSTARGGLSAFLHVVLPPQCVTCDEIVASPGLLCAECFAKTSVVARPFCESCAIPLRGGGEIRCAVCDLEPPPWREARAALRYDGQAKRMILPLKYHDRTDLAASLGPMMARAGRDLLEDADVLVPVPMHRRRLRQRRYNQAALLAWAVSRASGVDVAVDALVRHAATAPLAEQSAEARGRTVSGAFAVRENAANAMQGARIVLIDDVLTTGATCGECARVLLSAGAERVDVLVAARVGSNASRWQDDRTAAWA